MPPVHSDVFPRRRWHGACEEGTAMKTCECCGNSYDKCFDVTMDGKTLSFDSFECAIQTLAPICGHCGCRIMGHGVEGEGGMYCCAHCARSSGVEGVVDNADAA